MHQAFYRLWLRCGLSACAAACLACLYLLHGTAWAQAAVPQQSWKLPGLFAGDKELPLEQPVGMLTLPPDRAVTPDQLLSEPYASQFKAWQPGMQMPTSATQDVWLRLQLPAQARPQSWMFRIPRLTLEKATLYQRNADNPTQWQAQSAGIDLPNSSWPMRARDPIFEISTRSDQTQVFFIRLENSLPITENLQLIHSSDFGNGANYAGTLNGLIIGLFLVLTIVSAISWRLNRNDHFGWFAFFSLTVMLSQLTVSGYMYMRIWPNSTYLAQTMGWVLPFISLAALARFAISVSYAKDISKTVYTGLWAVIVLSIAISTLILLFMDSVPSLLLNVAYFAGILVIFGALSWVAWRSQHWLWMVAVSILPVLLSVIARIAYNLGWVAHVELAMLLSVITAAIGLICIYATLIQQQRLRLVTVQRNAALDTSDAATGLFNENIARLRLPQIILRSKRFNQACGAILVRWIECDKVTSNMRAIERGRVFSHLGNRLGRLARDIDTVARFGDDQFIYLIESPITRENLNALASKILSTCLRPSSAIPDQKGFDLHLAVWVSDELPADASQVFELLKTRIDQMRDGTQRRVQFIDTAHSSRTDSDRPSPEAAQQLVDKINSLEATQGLPRVALQPRRTDPPSSRPAQ